VVELFCAVRFPEPAEFFSDAVCVVLFAGVGVLAGADLMVDFRDVGG